MPEVNERLKGDLEIHGCDRTRLMVSCCGMEVGQPNTPGMEAVRRIGTAQLVETRSKGESIAVQRSHGACIAAGNVGGGRSQSLLLMKILTILMKNNHLMVVWMCL